MYLEPPSGVSGEGSQVLRESLILAGGLGTRLRAVVSDRPKPMAEVAGRPFITFLFDQLLRFGVERAVICVGHLGEYVPAILGSRYNDLELVYSFEQTPLGTGGALRNAAKLVTEPRILALNGDSFCNVDLQALEEVHARTGAAMTLAVLERSDRRRAGAISLDESGRVVAFESRPTTSGPGLINAGVYVLNSQVIDLIPSERKVSLEEEVFPLLVERRELYAFHTDGRFIDIGVPASYQQAQTFF